MLFEQFGERVDVSRSDEPEFELLERYRHTGVIKVTAEDATGPNGKKFIISAEVLLRPRSPHRDDVVRTLASKQLLRFRDQVFRIEAIGPFEAGCRKVTCVATRKESSNAASLGGR